MYEYENEEIEEMLKEFGIKEDTSISPDEELVVKSDAEMIAAFMSNY